jgi:serine/threonine protein kinase
MLINCDKVMQLLGIYEDNQHIHLVLEYIRGGSLKTYLARHRQLPETLIKKVMQQLLSQLN